jgi:flagellar hook assembly protein FlgD
MQITPTNSYPPAADDDSSRIPIKTLNQEDFLKLVIAQLTTEDSLNPDHRALPTLAPAASSARLQGA